MAKISSLKYVFWVYLSFFWCAFAYAAELSLDHGLSSLSGGLILTVLGLSILGGAAGTLTRMTARDAAPIRNLPLEIAKDVVTSIVAGMLAFFLSSWLKWDSFWPQAIFITVAGFGGSKVLEFSLNEGFFPFLSRVFGRAGIKNDEGAQ